MINRWEYFIYLSGIHEVSVHEVIHHDHLQVRNVCKLWVPQLLMKHPKTACVLVPKNIAGNLERVVKKITLVTFFEKRELICTTVLLEQYIVHIVNVYTSLPFWVFWKTCGVPTRNKHPPYTHGVFFDFPELQNHYTMDPNFLTKRHCQDIEDKEWHKSFTLRFVRRHTRDVLVP